MTRIVSLVVLLAIVVLCGWLVLRVMGQFMLPMFLAVVMVVVFRPLHNWLTEKLNGSVRIAAGLTTAAILVIVLLPLLATLTMAATEGISMARGLSQEKVLADLAKLRKRFSLEMPGKATFQKVDQDLNKADSAELSPAERQNIRQRIAQEVKQLREVVNDAMTSQRSSVRKSDELFEAYAKLAEQVKPWESLQAETPVDSFSDEQQLSQVRNSYDEFSLLTRICG